MKRLYGHIAHRSTLPGPALCGKPNRVEKGPAVFYCGKCVVAAVEEANHSYRVTISWPVDGGAI